MKRTSLRTPGRVAIVVGLASVVVGVSACSSDADESTSSTPRVAEPVSVNASEDTTREIGVVVWGAQSGAKGDFRIAGYGRDGAVAFVVEQRTIVDADNHNAFETTLSGPRAQAKMRLEGKMTPVDDSGHFEIALQMAENSFNASPLATNVLVRMQKDLEAAEAGSTASTSLLSPHGVSPMASSSGGGQLVQSCSPLLRQCAGSLVRAGRPLVPCAMALVQAGGILLCGVAGFFAGGPIGAIEAGAVCGIRGQGAVIRNGMECADRASDIYNNWGTRQNDVVNSCGNAASTCTGGSSGVAMSSLVP